MLNKQKIIILILLVLVLGGMGFGVYVLNQNNDARDSAAAKILGGEESTQYETLSGETVALDAYEGRVRVVNSWASWSPFSRQELQDLNRLAETYKDKDVAVIAINRNEEKVRAQRYLEQLGELPAIDFLIDGDDTFYDRLEGQAMPETLFFDRKGAIVFHARGELNYDEMVTYVEAALAAQ
jgi:thiol-disulfide isomerase/thioredoxin